MLHVYLFDTQGSSESVDVAKELVSMRLPDVKVLPVSAESVRSLMVSDGRVPLVPCVVSVDTKTGDWKDVFTNDFLFTHFMDPLRAATTAAAPPPPQSRSPPVEPHHQHRQLSINEIAQKMMEEREQDNPPRNPRFGMQ